MRAEAKGTRIRGKPRGAAAIFAVPILLALVSIAGLLGALLGDEIWDWASWLLLSMPLAAIAIAHAKRE